MRHGLLYLAPACASLLLAHCAAKDKADAALIDASVTDVGIDDMSTPEVVEGDAGQDAALQDTWVQQEADAPSQQEAEAAALDAPGDVSLPEAGGPCDGDATCPAPYACLYPVAERCAATTGLCLQPVLNCKEPIFCACSGQTVAGCGPLGGQYYPWPVQYAGPCAQDGGTQ